MNPLSDNSNLIDLVKKARFGCRESMDSLAQQIEPRVSAYIYRLTLNQNVTEDLRQETMLEMVRSLKNLRNAERFQAWLYRTALSKVQHYYRNRQRERNNQVMFAFDEELLQQARDSRCDGLNGLINKELSQAIVKAMARLKLRYRNVLILRCYEQLPYSEIAETMDCSEMAARVLFFRAKHSLRKNLSRHGFSRGMLVTALGLFGRMTAPADAGRVTISAASTEVGVTAAVIGTAGTKLGLTIAALIAAAAVTIGSFSALNDTGPIGEPGQAKLPKRSEVKSFHFIKQAWDKTKMPSSNLKRGRSLSKGAYEQWYYFPEGIDGPMFMMMQRWNPQRNNKLCGWMQNGSGNYYYHSGKKTIYLYNYHLPMRYLTTRRLPCDTQEFTEFLDQVEGKDFDAQYVRDPETGLLTGILDNRFYNAKNFESCISYNSLTEKSFDSFRYPWPEDAPVIDERDEMRKRGWSYFRVTGQLNGEDVEGWGRIPFIYNAYLEQRPWLKLDIGSKIKIADSSSGAYITGVDKTDIKSYPAGSFFKGLARPWAGMHAIDIIRRDAAEKRVSFTIKRLDEDYYGKVNLVLSDQTDTGRIEIVYTVDIGRDLLEKIEFLTGDDENNSRDILRFTYLEDVDQAAEEFAEPAKVNIRKYKQQESVGMLWLIDLAQGTLGQ